MNRLTLIGNSHRLRRVLSLLLPGLVCLSGFLGPLHAAPQRSSRPAALAQGGPAASPESARFSIELTLPATGQQTQVVVLPVFGRYRFWTESAQGVALRLLDPIEGPLPSSGAPGVQDGQLDRLLEAGRYRLETQAPPDGTGTFRLRGVRLEELQPDLPLLPEQTQLSRALPEQALRSFSLEVRRSRAVEVEASGQTLASLQLFREGDWPLEVVAQCALTADAATPRRVCRLFTTLSPGRYRLAVYGGKALPWPAGGGDDVMSLRLGIQTVSTPNRLPFVLGRTGELQLKLSNPVSLVRMILDAPDEAALQAAVYQPGTPPGFTPVVRLTRAQVPAVVEGQMPGGTSISAPSSQLLRVLGRPGLSGVLELLTPVASVSPLPGEGLFSLSTVGGVVEDELDVTGLITRVPRRPARAELARPERVVEQALALGSETVWTRRFNLLSEAGVLLKVLNAGTYHFRLDKAGQLRLEPFLLAPPRGYVPPTFASGDVRIELAEGLHLLTLKPGTPGVHRLSMGGDGPWAGFSSKVDEPSVQAKPLPGLSFPAVQLEPGFQHTLIRLGADRVKLGVSVLPLPLSPGGGAGSGSSTQLESFSAPVTIAAGGALPIPLQLVRPAKVWLEPFGKADLRLTVADGPPQAQLELPAGAHVIRVVGEVDRPTSGLLNVQLVPQVEPPLPPAPPLPVVSPGVAQFFDVERGATWLGRLTVTTPGLYRIRSLGDVAALAELRNRAGQVRGRAQGSLRDRSFLLLAFLGSGDYQLQVQGLTQGQQGRLGVILEPAQAREGEALLPGQASHHTLTPTEALTQRVLVPEGGVYRLRAFGDGRYFRTQLQDTHAQALYRSGAYGDVSLTLTPGEYGLTLVPEGTAARVTTLLEPLQPPRRTEGHGPFPLLAGQAQAHEWLEPVEGAERVPDLWTFPVTAPMRVWISLDNGMQAELEQAMPGSEPLKWEKRAWVAPGRPFSGALEPGQYRLAASAFRPNNRLAYSVLWIPDVLAPGLTRTVVLPAAVPLSLGEEGQYSVRTLCGRDARARLFALEDIQDVSSGGRQVAEADDGPDDWSPFLSGRFRPGRYRLQLDPVSSERTVCRVTLDPQREQVLPERGLPVNEGLVLESGTWVLPLVVAPGPDLLSIGLTGGGRLELSVALVEGKEGASRLLGRSEGEAPFLAVALPPSPPGPVHLQLRIKSLGVGGAKAQLKVEGLRLPRVAGRALERGLTFSAGSPQKPVVSGVLLMADGQGVFQLKPETEGILACVRGLEVCRPLVAGLYPAPEERLVLVARPGGGDQRVFGQVRFLAASGGLEGLQLPEAAAAHVELRLGGQGVTMVRATSPHGVPGLQLVADLDVPVDITGSAVASSSNQARPQGQASTRLGSSAVAVSLSSWPRVAARVWRAEAAEGSFDVNLQAWRFDRDVARPLRAGRTDVVLRPGSLQAYQLPQGRSSLSLTLASHGVAVLSRGEAVLEVVAASAVPSTRMLTTEADTLTLLNPERELATGLIELDSRNGAFDERGRERVTPEVPFERQLVTSGYLGLEVYPPDASDAVLRVEGAVKDVLLLDRAGRVSRGQRLTSTQGGRLLIAHEVGPVCVWWERPGGPTGLWGDGAEPPILDAGLPANLFLESSAQRIRISPVVPGMLELHVVSPLVVMVRSGAELLRTEVLDRGGSLEIPVLPAASAADASASPRPLELWVRSLGGAGAPGSLRLRFDPVQPWTGKEVPVLLVPGSSRTWWFRTDLGGPVGLGVRAEREVVEGRLFDASGRLIQEGPVMMADLPPGQWLVSFRLPADEAPVLAIPRVVGLVRPSEVASPELMASFRQAGQGAAPRLSPDAPEAGPSRPEWNLAEDILTFSVPEDPLAIPDAPSSELPADMPSEPGQAEPESEDAPSDPEDSEEVPSEELPSD